MQKAASHIIGSNREAFSQVEALRRALDAERAARAAAERESRAKSELLATVSHEVRTPMNAIIAMADLLLATELDDGQRRYADTLRQSCRGLLAILNDILDHSKLAAGRLELEAESFDPAALTRAAGEALAARVTAKDLSSGVEIAPDLPDRFFGDPRRIRQMLENLIDNAVKFTDSGSVTLRAAPARGRGDGALCFEVADTGPGIPEDRRRRLFEPWIRGDASAAARHGGTGLGLSIVRRLGEAMGGAAGCESVEGEGSVFWFTVAPADGADADADGFEDAGEPGSADPLPEGPLSGDVLVVEDNFVNQMLIQTYMENFGLAHETVADGEAALAALAGGRFDLVLMDIMMPDTDGIALTRRIRTLPDAVARVPVVALTANVMNGDRESYLAAGMDGYVAKPFTAGELYAALAAHLGQEEKRSDAAGA